MGGRSNGSTTPVEVHAAARTPVDSSSTPAAIPSNLDPPPAIPAPLRPLGAIVVASAPNGSASNVTFADDNNENPFISQSIPAVTNMTSLPRTPTRPRQESFLFSSVTSGASTGSRSSVEPTSSPAFAAGTDINNGATPSHEGAEPSVVPTPESTASKRLRAKKSDPIYGFVQGCHRGGGKVKIFRKRALRPVQIHQALATSRYHEGIQDILGRAERVAVESSSWIMVLAQHPNAYKGCYYFLSPRLYKDGVAPKGLELAQGFSDLTASLIQARRKDAAALAADNETLKRSLNEASEKQAELQRRIEELEATQVRTP